MMWEDWPYVYIIMMNLKDKHTIPCVVFVPRTTKQVMCRYFEPNR